MFNKKALVFTATFMLWDISACLQFCYLKPAFKIINELCAYI